MKASKQKAKPAKPAPQVANSLAQQHAELLALGATVYGFPQSQPERPQARTTYIQTFVTYSAYEDPILK